MRSLLAVVVLLGLAPSSVHAQCGEPGAQLQALVKAKTAVRRGPGLNYPVSAFVEDGRCMKVIELSIDGNWVSIEDPISKALGWVPTKQIDPASLEALSAARGGKSSSPVGSGQERSYVVTRKPVGLLAGPKRGAKERRVLPGSARLLALAASVDKEWLQVRDDRNETGWVMVVDVEDPSGVIAGLPVADSGRGGAPITPAAPPAASGAPAAPASARAPASAAVPASASAPAAATPEAAAPEAPDPAPAAVSERAPPPDDEDRVAFEVQVTGMFALPQHGLESDGNAGIRRYALRANGGGGGVALRASHVGPIEARVEYGLVIVGGLATAAEPTDVVSGQQHDARLLFGVPITLGPLSLIPEAGYTVQIYAMSPALKTRDEPTFFSHHTHLGTVGLRAVLDLAGYVQLWGEGHGTFGATAEYPFDLGQSGLTAGWDAGAGVSYAMLSTFGVTGRWSMRSARAPFVGPAPIDASITAATLVYTEQQFSGGVFFRF